MGGATDRQPRGQPATPHATLPPPSQGIAGEPAGQAGYQLLKAPSRPVTSLIFPTATWASVVRGSEDEPARFKPQPAVSTAEFSALYERCLASGPKARVVFSHAAGMQTVTITCSLPTTSATDATVVRPRRRRRRVRAATTAGNSTDGAPPTCTAASAVAAPAGYASTPSSPEVTSPPAKGTRKRRNEVELLRDVDGEGDLLLSPPSRLASPLSFSPSPPSRSEASFTASPTLLPPAPPENVPASSPACPPAPPELPMSPPPAEPAPADQHSLPNNSLQPAGPPPADQSSQPSNPLPPPSNTPPLTTEPSSPQPSPATPGAPTVPATPQRLHHQHDWDLCHECREHYHQKSYFHCWFCHYK
jgi:hypothetical protein